MSQFRRIAAVLVALALGNALLLQARTACAMGGSPADAAQAAAAATPHDGHHKHPAPSGRHAADGKDQAPGRHSAPPPTCPMLSLCTSAAVESPRQAMSAAVTPGEAPDAASDRAPRSLVRAPELPPPRG